MEKRDICRVLRKTFDSFYDPNFLLWYVRKTHRDGFVVDDEELGGYCGIASWYLALLFRRYGHEGFVVYGDFEQSNCDHCWVLSGKVYYDITASQFSLPDILISTSNSRHYRKYIPRRFYKRTSDYNGWGEFYRPNRKNGKIILDKFRQIGKEMGYI